MQNTPMTPSIGELKLDYIELLDRHHIVDRETLLDRDARVDKALALCDDAVGWQGYFFAPLTSDEVYAWLDQPVC